MTETMQRNRKQQRQTDMAAHTLDDLPTPALILDRAVLRRNLKRMSDRLRQAGVALRPHLKTAKSVQVGRMAVEVLTDGLQRFFELSGVHIDQVNRKTALGKNVGDAIAHGAGADHRNLFKRHVLKSLVRWSAPRAPHQLVFKYD